MKATMEKIEYEQFYGVIIELKNNPKIFTDQPNNKFIYLIENYYNQASAMFTENGMNHWKSFVANTIVRQGYFRNILKYKVPSLRAFAEQVGKREVVLLKKFNGTYVLEDEKMPKLTDRSVDNRMLKDWERNANITYWVMNELGDTIFEGGGNDFMISQMQHDCRVRVSSKVASAWKAYTQQWHDDSQGKIVEYPLVRDFMDSLPEFYQKQVKYLI